MAKNKARTVFFCTECGGESVKWYGKCPHCGAWNALVEERVTDTKAEPWRDPSRDYRLVKPQKLTAVSPDNIDRYRLDIVELDEVLGGGLVPGSSVLLGGEPGIGKSTLLLQTAAAMSLYGHTLYLSGEESLQQVRLRAERLGALSENIYLLSNTDLESSLEAAAQLDDIRLLIVDSVQAVAMGDISSAPGSVSQVRAVTHACLNFAKERNIAVILVGHVTKEGLLAGPRVLEHMVDAVLYFEGERHNSFRLLRAVKNRFGSTNEIGVFEMESGGLVPVSSPSAYFLGQKRGQEPGKAVSCVMQGTRPMLIELQALVAASSFGNPRRFSSGFDYNRMLMIIAVLEKKLGMKLMDKDVYLNVAGGLRIDDPAADLAAAAAVASACLDRPLDDNLLLFGEVGLLGELRLVSQAGRRIKEGSGFGFTAAVVPDGTKDEVNARYLTAKDLREALAILGLHRVDHV